MLLAFRCYCILRNRPRSESTSCSSN
ncbi:hypothetical protein ZOSMA_68G00350 [Zostera marina]|uniref:Uncharacterized protein n=1 Tax=Zostera marina TaxID=29655 RepID=A0A0K9NS64_ZOSMR|nr:hypothetical protein ZOSMA_68G00350 [Zostera marina]